MSDKKLLTKGDYIIVLLFITVIVSAILITITGIPYVIIEASQMSFWLVILIPLGTIMSGIIFTYSLAQYTLERQFRDLVLLLMAVNMLLDGFLYLLTNSSFVAFSPFANRDRNRTIVIAFGLILGPSVLFGSLSSYSIVSRRQKYSLLAWGALVVPAVSLWFFFSPEPVFITTPVGSGIFGFSPVAWFFFLFIPSSMFIAVAKYLRTWRIDRNRINLSSALALCIWFLTVILFATQTDPFQLMELVWYSSFVMGLFLISIAIITSSVIEPRKIMINLVRERTKQLEESREESEFYLNVWGHKIGNLLQSMMLYLELISISSQRDETIIELADAALEIGRESGQINRQVAALIKLKQREHSKLVPVNINDSIVSSLEIIENLFDSDCLKNQIAPLSYNFQVLADDFLELVFVNLFSFICKHNDSPEIVLSPIVKTHTFNLNILFNEPRIPVDIEKSLFSEMQPSRTTLSLDLYTVKILMAQFDGSFEYSWIQSLAKNQFTLIFNHELSDEEEFLPLTKSTKIVD